MVYGFFLGIGIVFLGDDLIISGSLSPIRSKLTSQRMFYGCGVW